MQECRKMSWLDVLGVEAAINWLFHAVEVVGASMSGTQKPPMAWLPRAV